MGWIIVIAGRFLLLHGKCICVVCTFGCCDRCVASLWSRRFLLSSVVLCLSCFLFVDIDEVERLLENTGQGHSSGGGGRLLPHRPCRIRYFINFYRKSLHWLLFHVAKYFFCSFRYSPAQNRKNAT